MLLKLNLKNIFQINQTRSFSLVSYNSKVGNANLDVKSSLDVSSNLKLKSIFFDINVLIGQTLKDKADSIIKIESTKTNHLSDNIPLIKEVVKEVNTVQTKYMDKLRQRLGGNVSDLNGKSELLPKGDAKLLNSAKSLASSDSAITRWLLSEGMGDLLDYTSKRSIKLGIIPRDTTILSTIETFIKQLKGLNFQILLIKDNYDINSLVKELNEYIELNKIESKHVLIISNNEKSLELSKKSGYLTCRFKFPDTPNGQFSCNFTATNAIELQDIVEEMNGISLRNSAFGSRSYNFHV